MADPFLGEIRAFAFGFVPNGWASCNGQTMSISQNTALFSIIGTAYGGNGTSTFNLPDLQGRAPMNQGAGTGLTPRSVGDTPGENGVALQVAEMPAHAHRIDGATSTTSAPPATAPQSNSWLSREAGSSIYSDQAPNTLFAPQALGITGQGLAHENRQPFLALNFCISLAGNFPPRP